MYHNHALLRVVRTAHKQSQEDFGARFGLTRETISKIENFHADIPKELAEYIASRLDALPDDVIAKAEKIAQEAEHRHRAAIERQGGREDQGNATRTELAEKFAALVEAENEVDIIFLIDVKEEFPNILAEEWGEAVELSQDDKSMLTQEHALEHIKNDIAPALRKRGVEKLSLMNPPLAHSIWAFWPTTVPGIFGVAASGTREGEGTFMRALTAFVRRNENLIYRFVDNSSARP